jgi:hypothetical protein
VISRIRRRVIRRTLCVVREVGRQRGIVPLELSHQVSLVLRLDGGSERVGTYYLFGST